MDAFVAFCMGIICTLVTIMAIWGNPATIKRAANCEFVGGKMHADVCVVDGKVVNLKDAKVVIQQP